MGDGLLPRWKHDCLHCKFNWCCGPVCACTPVPRSRRPWDFNEEHRCYCAIRLDNPNDKRNDKGRIPSTDRRYRLIDVQGCVISRDEVITYRLRGQPWTQGRVVRIYHACEPKLEYESTTNDLAYVIELEKA